MIFASKIRLFWAVSICALGCCQGCESSIPARSEKAEAAAKAANPPLDTGAAPASGSSVTNRTPDPPSDK